MGELINTATYKRRVLKLGTTDNFVDVVLWGDAAVSASNLTAKKVTVSAVIVEERQLRSTPSTVLEVYLFCMKFVGK